MKAKVYNQQGKELKTVDLPQDIFGVTPKAAVVHQVVTAIMANLRQPLAHTKTKGEVSGGGRKPWKQKGTGRARHGSSRSPIWKGGGVTFGPRNDRNYQQKINKKMGSLALKMVLSDKALAEKIKLIDNLDLVQAKTKELSSILEKLSLKNVMIITAVKNEAAKKAASNLAKVEVTNVSGLNIVDLLKYKEILLTEQALEKISVVFGAKTKVSTK